MFYAVDRRKMHVRITELEEQINALISKCSGLEKQKSRLQSEVEVLIIDLEKVRVGQVFPIAAFVAQINLLYWIFIFTG